MTREECKYIRKVLERIKEPDEHILKAISFVDKQLAIYNAQIGQLKDQYESNYDWM